MFTCSNVVILILWVFKENWCWVCSCLVAICPVLRGQFFQKLKQEGRSLVTLTAFGIRGHKENCSSVCHVCLVWKWTPNQGNSKVFCIWPVLLCALQLSGYQIFYTSFPLYLLCVIPCKTDLYNSYLTLACSGSFVQCLYVFAAIKEYFFQKLLKLIFPTNKIFLTTNWKLLFVKESNSKMWINLWLPRLATLSHQSVTTSIHVWHFPVSFWLNSAHGKDRLSCCEKLVVPVFFILLESNKTCIQMNHTISDCSLQVLAIPNAKWPLWFAGAVLRMLAADQ